MLAAQAVGMELSYLDAPVSGGVAGAEAANLAILVGGALADFAAVEPVLCLLWRPTHLGSVGAEQSAKLANQLIGATTKGAAAEALRLTETAGCDPVALRGALRGGFAGSRILELHGKRMVEGNFKPGGRSVVRLKDLNNAMSVAQSCGLNLPLAKSVTAAFRDFVTYHNGSEQDHAASYEWLKLRLS